MKTLLSYAAALVAFGYLLRQARKPSKWVGRFFVRQYNHSHSKLTDWGLSHVSIEKNFTILDVGCGGGRTVQKLAAIAADGMVFGIDYSEGSVAASSSTNSKAINAGRVEIRKASVSHLPFLEGEFDLVTAVETQYYWPDVVNDMKEILRVLKPGGTLIIIAETYKGSRFDSIQWPVMKLLGSTHLSVDDQRGIFAAAGYEDVQVFQEDDKGWICVKGRKPSSS